MFLRGIAFDLAYKAGASSNCFIDNGTRFHSLHGMTHFFFLSPVFSLSLRFDCSQRTQHSIFNEINDGKLYKSIYLWELNSCQEPKWIKYNSHISIMIDSIKIPDFKRNIVLVLLIHSDGTISSIAPCQRNQHYRIEMWNKRRRIQNSQLDFMSICSWCMQNGNRMSTNRFNLISSVCSHSVSIPLVLRARSAILNRIQINWKVIFLTQFHQFAFDSVRFA